MNAKDPEAPESLLARNRERYAELVRLGMTPEELYRLVIAEGGSRGAAFVSVRDHFGLDAMTSMAMETLGTEERNVEAPASQERSVASAAPSDNPYSPPLAASSDLSRAATSRRLPVWLSVSQVVANLAAFAMFVATLAILLAAAWFMFRLRR